MNQHSKLHEPHDDGSWGRVIALYLGALGMLVLASSILTAFLPTQEGLIAVQVFGVLGAALGYSQLMGDRRAPWPSLDRIGIDLRQFLLMSLAAIALGLAANAMMGLTVELIPAFEGMAERYRENLNELVLEAEGFNRVLGIIAICAAAPVCEETLFRGTLLQEQREVSRTWLAVAGNGLLFSMFHLNPIGLVPLAIVGAFLAHLIVLTESLWPAILAHVVFNGFNGVVLPELVPDFDQTELSSVELLDGAFAISPVGQFIGAILVFGAVGAFFWVWLAQTTEPPPTPEPSDE